MSSQLNYQYALVSKGQVLDITNLDYGEPEHAEYLFMEEFGWREKLGVDAKFDIELVSVTDDPD